MSNVRPDPVYAGWGVFTKVNAIFTSECFNGFKYIVSLRGVGVGPGRGAGLTEANLGVYDDAKNYVDVRQFVGSFVIAGGGGAIGGADYSTSMVRFGDVEIDGGDNTWGFEVGAGASFGRSSLTSLVQEKCEDCGGEQ